MMTSATPSESTSANVTAAIARMKAASAVTGPKAVDALSAANVARDPKAVDDPRAAASAAADPKVVDDPKAAANAAAGEARASTARRS